MNLNSSIKYEEYKWENLPIGGGGYVTGICIHPLESDLIYIRTDVGGCYRWDKHEEGWIPLMDCFGLEERNFYGIDGIALDRLRPDVVYAACGKYSKHKLSTYYPVLQQGDCCDVLKSEDRGRTWKRTNLNQDFEGNLDLRWFGECIAVDPNNSSIVYCGTRYGGLWRSYEATENDSWKRVDGIQGDGEGKGIRSILFDINSEKTGISQIIYISICGDGIYRSDDAGLFWTKLEGSSINTARMTLGDNGILYVTSDNGVYMYNGSWVDVSPKKGISYCAIDVDKMNCKHLVCAESYNGFWCPVYNSEDSGKSWTSINENIITHNDVPWWPKEYFSAATSSIVIDPQDGNKVWLTDWYGVWRTEDINAVPCHFYSHEKGHEEMVSFTMACPTEGANILTAIADNDGNRYIDLNCYPDSKYCGPSLQETTGIDFCEAYPQYVARVGSWNWGEKGSGGYSKDNGKTWNEFVSWPFGGNGKLAMSSMKRDSFVVVPINETPKYTVDGGETWHESSGIQGSPIKNFWSWNNPIASDRADGSRFYIYVGGAFYVSYDFGATWKKTCDLAKEEWHHVKAAPRIQGEVWISLNNSGLFRSTDAGYNFSKLQDIDQAYIFCFGKNPPGKEHPSVFLYGQVHKVKGIFRSDDMGLSWIKINDENHKFGNDPNCMEGDRQVFGRVYIGTNGRGYYYGELLYEGGINL